MQKEGQGGKGTSKQVSSALQSEDSGGSREGMEARKGSQTPAAFLMLGPDGPSSSGVPPQATSPSHSTGRGKSPHPERANPTSPGQREEWGTGPRWEVPSTLGGQHGARRLLEVQELLQEEDSLRGEKTGPGRRSRAGPKGRSPPTVHPL